MLVFERNNEWLRTFQDSLWLIVVTAFTIGYGDIYPKTFPGRAISITAGILGVIFAALGTAALSNKLAWTTAEYNVSKLLLKSVMEKKLANQAIIYLQRTYRRITNRAPNRCWSRHESRQRKDREDWIETKQEHNAFQQNQNNMELLLKGILDDSGKINKVARFLNDHDATKEWIATVTKGNNHPLQLQVSVNLLEEQLNNLKSLAAAALEKQKSQGGDSASAVVKREHIVDPNDDVIDSLILELNSLCDVLDENNKDLEWFANEIDARVRGKKRVNGPGPSWQTSSDVHPEPQHHHQQQPQTSHLQPTTFSAPVASPLQPMYLPGQAQSQAFPESIAAMQQQAALQMQLQTALMAKLLQALESPRRNRGQSSGRNRSRSRNRGDGRGRSASTHSRRSRSRHVEAIYSSEEEGRDQFSHQTASRRNSRILRSNGAQQDEFSVDGEVWVDDVDSAASSRPSSRPQSAFQHVLADPQNDDANSNGQPTPRIADQASRLQRLQRR